MKKNSTSTIAREIATSLACFSFFLLTPVILFAQEPSMRSPGELKKLSVEELMNIQVTSVSKAPENLKEVASAIQVITGEDIRRSSVTRLPEALRLASNLQVAQSNSHDWGITARGFNGAPLSSNTLADKLLVMIDGRTIYTPLFGGVFWDAQNILLEDVDRIEVVSGPGGTLWGANAMNGVINVTSKDARETQGLYASETFGTFLRNHFAMRYGGQLDSVLFFRVYGQYFNQDATTIPNGTEGHDKWRMLQGGFRMDYHPSLKDHLTFQGDFYGGKVRYPDGTLMNGQNVLARWSHTFSNKSDLIVHAYYDRAWRNLQSPAFSDDMRSIDIDLQHSFSIAKIHKIVWGQGTG